jgi:hypothetical protein
MLMAASANPEKSRPASSMMNRFIDVLREEVERVRRTGDRNVPARDH